MYMNHVTHRYVPVLRRLIGLKSCVSHLLRTLDEPLSFASKVTRCRMQCQEKTTLHPMMMFVEREGWVLLKIPRGDIDGVGEVK